ncbi:HAD hydrolase family protein [Halovivax limisalsi]|uniref:HAD hydrolase family protein n=1 Tax=Halovivax limisalsi TaxID=1453760 RepID=UPI001FFD384A|nr:HAD hydrolase family protein [Halovivax limisalsi]
MTQVPPLVLDIDGTLTRPAGPGLDARVFAPLRGWEAPIVLATGKAAPYPVALCHFLAIPERAVAENGGVVVTDDRFVVAGDREGPAAVAREYERAGYDLGWDGLDTINQWRETEVAVSRDQPREPLEAIARAAGLRVVDTGYAYHVIGPHISKGASLEAHADELTLDLEAAVAIGDSENDVSTFERVDRSFAVRNADAAAKAAADEVVDGEHADGTLSILERLRD